MCRQVLINRFTSLLYFWSQLSTFLQDKKWICLLNGLKHLFFSISVSVLGLQKAEGVSVKGWSEFLLSFRLFHLDSSEKKTQWLIPGRLSTWEYFQVTRTLSFTCGTGHLGRPGAAACTLLAFWIYVQLSLEHLRTRHCRHVIIWGAGLAEAKIP